MSKSLKRHCADAWMRGKHIRVAVAGIAFAGYYSFKMYDQHEDTVRIARELEMYQDAATLNDVLRNDPRYVAFSTGSYNICQH